MKNFSKSFISLLVFLSIFSVANAATSNIDDLVFTTEMRSVSPGEISEAITVQTQNSSGTAEKIDETNDVTFTSSSPTGEFLNSSGNEVTTTMAKNTSSRTFYYRDNTEGEYTLTIEITGRDTGKSFSASQKIIVGEGGSNQSDDDENTTATGKSETKNNSSSHGSQTAVSSLNKKQVLKSDAGRERLVSVNTRVEFKAETSSSAESSDRLRYEWSFGDGTSIRGKAASHIYSYPGEYIVVLNIKSETEESVSRTKVIVTEPNVVLGKIDMEAGFAEVINNTSNEINLGNWSIVGKNGRQVLANDTIVKSKGAIKFPITFKESEENISLLYPNGKIAFTNDSSEISEDDSLKLTTLQNELLKVQEKMKMLVIEENKGVLPAIGGGEETSDNLGEFVGNKNVGEILSKTASTTSTDSVDSTKPIDETATLIKAFDTHEDNQGFFEKSLNFVKGIFGK